MIPERVRHVAVLGAGNGGIAAAADLTHRGFEVRLHARREERLAPIRRRGGIEMTGVADAFVVPHTVTTDLADAIRDVDCILLVVPSTAHEAYAQALAPILTEDQIVLVNPGHSFGGLHVANTLKREGFLGTPLVCETVTLSYVCRMEGAARIGIYKHTENLGFGAFPGALQKPLLEAARALYPNLVPAANVLEMGLSNINAIFHPPGMIMNAGWIQRTEGNFLFYAEGMTEAPGLVSSAVDRERLAIASALGLNIQPFIEHFHEVGLTTEAAMKSGSIARACEESAPNATIKAPASLQDRYVLEDVGYGLVPFSYLGRLANVPTPSIDALIQLSSIAVGRDLMVEGRTLETIGLGGIPLDRLDRFIESGVR